MRNTNPKLFVEGAKWSFVHSGTGEVRHYVLEEILPQYGGGCAMYGMRRVDIENGGLGWATHGTLQGVTSTEGWAPGHVGAESAVAA